MTTFKYILLIINFAFAFYFLSTESGLALVNAAAALGLMVSIYFEE